MEVVHLAGLKDLNDPDEGRFVVKFKGSYSEILDFWRAALRATDPTLASEEVEAIAKSNTDEVVRSGYAPQERVVAFTRHVIEHVVRVACFTKLPLNYSMWSNYAKYFDPVAGPLDHGGICIEYRCDDSWRGANLHPVKYSDALPEINAIERSELNLVNTVYMKTKEWRCEEEWRIMSVIQSTPPFPANFAANSKIKIENGVSSVIFGLNTPDSVIDEIRS
ncbi:DUF2971 domain-containing protein [Polaromonas sp. P1(28)-13]|nr:DUF2971 domain-containing protein [Polaromonas sp. P1(28)-13]